MVTGQDSWGSRARTPLTNLVRLSWMINRTFGLGSMGDPFGASLGFMAYLLDFLVGMVEVNKIGFHEDDGGKEGRIGYFQSL